LLRNLDIYNQTIPWQGISLLVGI